MESLIELKGVTKTFPIGGLFGRRQSLTALEDIDLKVGKGEILAILGESGSGKSTLARILTRLERPDRGSMTLDGQNLGPHIDRKAYGARVQMIFQDPFASLNGVHTVGYHLRRPLTLHKPKLSMAAVEAEAIGLLEAVGLRPGASFLEKYPFELSGGQRQRVAIARALTVEPDLLIADEPTSMLDVSIRMDILNLIRGLRDSRGLSIVMITHDLPSAWYLSDRVAVIYAGQIVETGPTASILAAPAHPYTQLLLRVSQQKILHPRDSVRSGDPMAMQLRTVAGCLFAPRCPRALRSCQVSAPALEALGTDRAVRCYVPFATQQRESLDA